MKDDLIRIKDAEYVRDCDKCIWATRSGGCASWNCEYVDKHEAYEAWNRAMGAKDINVPNKDWSGNE